MSGWLTCHWRALLGAASLLEPVWRLIKWLLHWASDFDFVISRIQNPSWVGVVINWLIKWVFDPPAWVTIPALIAGVALIFWDFRRQARRAQEYNRHNSFTLDATATVTDPAPMPIPSTDLASLPGMSEAVSRVQNEVARSVARMPHSQEPPNLDKLFDQDERGFIQLRFMPDTERENEDALLLIVYGYKVLGGHEDIKASTAESSLRRSGGLYKKPRNFGEQVAGVMFRTVLDFEEIIRTCVSDGAITKYKLAQGGYLAITETGMIIAGRLADDLIKRA
jgi:hypothetical protein